MGTRLRPRKDPVLKRVEETFILFKKPYLALALLFLLVFGLRLYFAFKTNTFESDEAYFNLRQIEHIAKTGMPLFNDELSYGGRKIIFLPTYHYFLGLFGFVIPIGLVAKIFPNLVASSIVFIVYLISKEMTKNVRASLFAAFAAGFTPGFFGSTINNISQYSFAIPLFFLTIYFFIRSESSEENAYYCLFSLSLLILMHASALLLIFGMLFYLLLVKIEKLKWSWIELEITLFAVFLAAWFYFIVFKKALLMNGYSIIWQNTPPLVLDQIFSQITVFDALYLVGIVPFILGIYIIYQNMFGERRKSILLLSSLTMVIALLLWLRLIKPLAGIYFLGIILVILFSNYCKRIFVLMEKTKVDPNTVVSILILIAIIGTSFVPAIVYAQEHTNDALSSEEMNALVWIRENTPNDAVILAGVGEGHYISEIAQRKNVADTSFLLSKKANEIVKDVHELYSTEYETKAVQLIAKYDINFIYVSKATLSEQGVKELRYTADAKCFKLVYDEGVKIFEPVCTIKEIN